MKRGADFALNPWEHQPAEAKEAAVTAAVEAIHSMQGSEEVPVSSEVVAYNLQRWVRLVEYSTSRTRSASSVRRSAWTRTW